MVYFIRYLFICVAVIPLIFFSLSADAAVTKPYRQNPSGSSPGFGDITFKTCCSPSNDAYYTPSVIPLPSSGGIGGFIRKYGKVAGWWGVAFTAGGMIWDELMQNWKVPDGAPQTVSYGTCSSSGLPSGYTFATMYNVSDAQCKSTVKQKLESAYPNEMPIAFASMNVTTMRWTHNSSTSLWNVGNFSVTQTIQEQPYRVASDTELADTMVSNATAAQWSNMVNDAVYAPQADQLPEVTAKAADIQNAFNRLWSTDPNTTVQQGDVNTMNNSTSQSQQDQQPQETPPPLPQSDAITPLQKIDHAVSFSQRSLVNWAGTCPQPMSFSVYGQSMQFSFDPACSAAGYMRSIIISLASVLAVYIVGSAIGIRRPTVLGGES